MWPFLLPVVAVVVGVWFARSEVGRPCRKGLMLTFSVATTLAILGIVLLGIPGAVVYELSAPWVRLMLGEGYADLGDGAWPAALLITLTWPFSLVLAYVAVKGPLRHRSKLIRFIAWIAIPYAAGVLLALWAHLSTGTAS